jgi:hypothetical protein
MKNICILLALLCLPLFGQLPTPYYPDGPSEISNATQLQGIKICTGTPTNTQLLTYSTANGCWQAASGITGNVIGNVTGTASSTMLYSDVGSSAIATYTITGGGSYSANDVLSVVQTRSDGGTVVGARIKVLTVSGGVIQTSALQYGGFGHSVASGLATTGGTGTGATVSIATLTAPGNSNVQGSQDTLFAYSIPANTLNANGKAVRVTIYYQANAGADLKYRYLAIGGKQVSFGGNTQANVPARAVLDVVRLTPTTFLVYWNDQMATIYNYINQAATDNPVTLDPTTPIAVVFSGLDNSSGTANEVTFLGATVQQL